MDRDRRGYILQEDLVNFEGTNFSASFIKQIFQTYIPSDGTADELRMGLTEFADFVLAWRDRTSSESISYFFKVFDVNNKGYLDRVDVHMFFKEASLAESQAIYSIAPDL